MAAGETATREKKNVLLLIGGTWHPFEACAKVAADILKSSGRYKLTVTDDREVLAGPLGKYDAVMIYTCGGKLTPQQETGLVEYVRRGGGLVAVHSATAISPDCRDYLALIGSQFDTHPREHKFEQVRIVGGSHQATTRLADFSLTEELYVLKNVAPDVRVLAETTYQCRPMPVMYARSEGKGASSTRPWGTASGSGRSRTSSGPCCTGWTGPAASSRSARARSAARCWATARRSTWAGFTASSSTRQPG